MRRAANSYSEQLRSRNYRGVPVWGGVPVWACHSCAHARRTHARRWRSARASALRGVESWQTPLELRAAIVPVPRRSPRALFARRPALRWVAAPACRVPLQLRPLQLDGAPRLCAGYLAAFQPAVGPSSCPFPTADRPLRLGGVMVVPPGSGGAPFPSFLATPPPGLLRTPTASFRTLRGPGEGV
jgi:hypothetical protein